MVCPLVTVSTSIRELGKKNCWEIEMRTYIHMIVLNTCTCCYSMVNSWSKLVMIVCEVFYQKEVRIMSLYCGL